MNDERDPLLLDHEADGIRELDNKLPRWWVLLFYATIGFAAVYLMYYHVLGAAPLSTGQYERDRVAGDHLKAAALAKFESNLEALQPSKDPLVVDQGKRIFSQLCAPCHRADGGGLVGPNLTDDYWIHGPKFTDNIKVIWNGVPEKGMVTWKGTLKPDEIMAVASYIYTLRGTHPPNPKPPENQTGAQPAVNQYE